MQLLLLSLNASPVPVFIERHVGKPAATVRIGYVNDAATPHGGEEFAAFERQRLQDFGYELTDLEVRTFASGTAFGEALDEVDAVYVAGGNTFALLESLRTTGAAAVLTERVRAGLPYIGLSAGTIVAGTSAEPASLMDDPSCAPGLTDRAGLGLVDFDIVPHADGALPPYPVELIARIEQEYGATHKLRLLRDDAALLVEHGTVTEVSAA